MLNYKYQAVRYITVGKNCTSQVLGVFQTMDAAEAHIAAARAALVTTEKINVMYTIRQLDSRGRAERDELVTIRKHIPVEIYE